MYNCPEIAFFREYMINWKSTGDMLPPFPSPWWTSWKGASQGLVFHLVDLHLCSQLGLVMYAQTQILQASCCLTWGDLLPQRRDLCAPVILSIIPALCSPQQAGRGVPVLLTVLADGLNAAGVRLHRGLCVCLLQMHCPWVKLTLSTLQLLIGMQPAPRHCKCFLNTNGIWVKHHKWKVPLAPFPFFKMIVRC